MTKPKPYPDQTAGALLTGFWTGVFDTADLSFEATPFHVFLQEEAGMLSGQSVEPNGFSPDAATELFASLEGWRDGPEIEFLKTYEDAIGAGFGVRFEGALEAQATRIVGVWTMLEPERAGAGIACSGPFVMDRKAEAGPPSLGAQTGREDR